MLRESRSNSLVNETSFSTPESTPPPQCTSSTSSPHRYSIDDAAIDEVTMAILRSALFDENIEPQISSPPLVLIIT